MLIDFIQMKENGRIPIRRIETSYNTNAPGTKRKKGSSSTDHDFERGDTFEWHDPGKDRWSACVSVEDKLLRAAWLKGQVLVNVEARGQKYEINLELLKQRNVVTGAEKRLRPPFRFTPFRKAGKKPPPTGTTTNNKAQDEDSFFDDLLREERARRHKRRAEQDREWDGTWNRTRRGSYDANTGPREKKNDGKSDDDESEPPRKPTPLQSEPKESELVNKETCSVHQELKATIGKTLAERKVVLKNLQLRCHPDKNPGKEDEFKQVFQFLMQYKEWYLLGERKI